MLPLLLDLVGKSLVVADNTKAETRYRFLETIREYAWEKMAAADEVQTCRQRHSQYCLAFVQETAPAEMRETGSAVAFVLGTDSDPWIKKLILEHDNFRAALLWTLGESNDIGAGAQLVHWLYMFWLVHGPREEAINWIERTLRHGAAAMSAVTRARLLTALSDFAETRGDFDRAESASIESVAICRALGSRFDLMRALQMRIGVVSRRAEFDQARIMGEEWLSIARELGHRRYEAIALWWLGNASMRLRDFERAAVLHDESVRLTPLEETGTRISAKFMQAQALWWWKRDGVIALAQYAEALGHYRETGFEFGSATVLQSMSDVHLYLGELDNARRRFSESLTLLHRQGARQRMVWALAGLAAVSAAERKAVRALTLWSAADLLRAKVNSLNVSMSHDTYVSLINTARATRVPQTLVAALAAGQAMSLDQIVAFALAD